MILEGTTSSGAVVPVQVTGDGKVVAEGLQGPQGPEGPEGPEGPPGPAGGYWERTGTVVSPTNAGDDLTLGGDLSIDGSSKRIRGDFSAGVLSERLSFQTSLPSGNTILQAIPAGTNALSQFRAFNSSDPTNSSSALFGVDASKVYVTGSSTGTGTHLPLIFSVGGAERVRVATTGQVGVGASNPAAHLHLLETDATAYDATAANGQIDVGPTIYLQNPANINTSVGGQIVFGMRSAQDQARIGATGGISPSLFFCTANQERARISEAGVFTLGDGTTNAVSLDPGSTGVPLVRDSVGRLLVGMNNAPAGTLAGDVVCQGSLVLQSPNGMWWAIEVEDDGTLSVLQTSVR